MVELAWIWVRFQPDSQLSHWFNQRIAGTGNAAATRRYRGPRTASRNRAVAYFEHGEILTGAILKS